MRRSVVSGLNEGYVGDDGGNLARNLKEKKSLEWRDGVGGGVRDIILGGFEKPRKDEERWGCW